jgi:hypothetical protein
MAKDSELVQLALLLAKYSKGKRNNGGIEADARTLLAAARVVGRAALSECNDDLPAPARAKMQRRVEIACERIVRVLADYDHRISYTSSGDPRGYPIKLHFPGKEYNTWGGAETGWGIGSL